MSILYFVATPIGNLGDISFRAVETLKNVDLILCEDTRTSARLLQEYGISTPTQSYHLHNEHQRTQQIIDWVEGGKQIALISDAGTPGISDPGFLLVREAQERGIRVEAIPGASAVLTALVLSGLPSDRFIFEGFLPPKKGRKKRVESWLEEERTIVIYESVHRIHKLLDEMAEYLQADRKLAVTRELTKTFQEVIRGTITEVKAICETHENLKGEFVVVLAGKDFE
ncbi:16S rRNA (cytidine(1402)-2'-O)-methyltransferase [bacterium]|nr:MAG: 16S rRNA (cytidine(1402)-2'-O)-methyltransferase [bacterium]